MAKNSGGSGGRQPERGGGNRPQAQRPVHDALAGRACAQQPYTVPSIVKQPNPLIARPFIRVQSFRWRRVHWRWRRFTSSCIWPELPRRIAVVKLHDHQQRWVGSRSPGSWSGKERIKQACGRHRWSQRLVQARRSRVEADGNKCRRCRAIYPYLIAKRSRRVSRTPSTRSTRTGHGSRSVPPEIQKRSDTWELVKISANPGRK